MEVFQFFRMLLMLTATVTACWPINIPLMALAYKVHNGARPMPLEWDALWLRSVLASLGLAILAIGMMLLDWFLIDYVALPTGIVHLVVFAGFFVIGMCYLFWSFAFEDLMEAAGVLTLYVTLPGVPLFFLWLIGFTLPLAPANSWLARVT